MFSTVISIVEEMKYTTKEEAETSINKLSKAKIEEAKRVVGLADSIKMLENDEKFFMKKIEDFYFNKKEGEDKLYEYIARRDLVGDFILMKHEEFNDIFHNFVRESFVVDNIRRFIQEIDFDKKGIDNIKNFLHISSNIIQEYSRNMLPVKCTCKEGHIGCDEVLYTLLG
jgi:hypothetical protein